MRSTLCGCHAAIWNSSKVIVVNRAQLIIGSNSGNSLASEPELGGICYIYVQCYLGCR